jgi:hypothetical protein
MSDFINELRELTSSGRDRIAMAKLRAEEEARQKEDRQRVLDQAKADNITGQIKERCRKEALAGRDFAIVMSIKYTDFKPVYNGPVTYSSGTLRGASAIVWQHCVDEGLSPTLEDWHDGMGINGGYNIVVHW